MTRALPFLAALALSTCTGLAPVTARDDGSWNDAPQDVREWFASVMQPNNPYQSCCGEADGFAADDLAGDVGDDPLARRDFRVVVTKGRGIVPDGLIVTVPRNKIQTQYGNPTGHAIVFLGVSSRGNAPIVYCYVPLPGL